MLRLLHLLLVDCPVLVVKVVDLVQEGRLSGLRIGQVKCLRFVVPDRIGLRVVERLVAHELMVVDGLSRWLNSICKLVPERF